MEQKKLFELENENSGIMCDNPDCDWEDKTVKNEDLKNWINTPCPKCGENVLTQEDYDDSQKFLELIKIFNDLPLETKEFLEKLGEEHLKENPDALGFKVEPNEKVRLSVHCHKGIKTKVSKIEKE